MLNSNVTTLNNKAERISTTENIAMIRITGDETVNRCLLKGEMINDNPNICFNKLLANVTENNDQLRFYFDGADFYAIGRKAGADAVTKKLGSGSNMSAALLKSTQTYSLTAENKSGYNIKFNASESVCSDDIVIGTNGRATFNTAGKYYLYGYVPNFGNYSSAAILKNGATLFGQAYVGSDRVTYNSFRKSTNLESGDVLHFAWGCTTWTSDTCGFNSGAVLLIIKIG